MINQNIYGYEMARISEVYLSTLSSIMKPFGIERYFAPLLFLCENSGKVTQKDLAEALKRDKVSTMRMVDYLSERGLLIRTQDCNDRRCQILKVTDKALKLLPKIKEGVQQTNDLLLRDFTEEEKVSFKKSMDKLFTTIGSLPEPDFIVKAYKRNNK
ncbi:MAG: hypothetical protein CMD31_09020 [Flavobacteriales bacterium]|mgnify:FL=1|jgi:DNA-binding MarR family transcriptional regulator|nr:MarR family transcriptional regulator [Flavobacteriales bacterium]MBQ20882.1 hypothetical protein [Flavobacteriales bacterium]|tara:strand:+ start:50782 stop:51252 length:471 start_codon:yes stop_codon:yes gene_type:complete